MSVKFSSIDVGVELPELSIPITRSLIVTTAIASRDYQDVHHHHELAQDRGSKDIFMNILTTNGLVGRYVTDWSGPKGHIREVNIRLGAPNYPDDTMVMTGQVASVEAIADDPTRKMVVVAIRGSNSLGDHVTGTVRITVPGEDH
ncbi:MAG: hypothetical protein WCK25_02195 [Actinomycetes bacterium]